jgi:hypothetical protein
LLTDRFTELEARELKPLLMVLGLMPMGIKVSGLRTYLCDSKCANVRVYQVSLRNVPVVSGVAYLDLLNTSICRGCVDERKEGYLIRLQGEFQERAQEEIALMAVSSLAPICVKTMSDALIGARRDDESSE